jgi:enterochelin esterase family protein
MVFLDGARFVQRDGDWRVPVVLDNLIARREIPVMAAVFVDPGQRLRDSSSFDEQRSYEYCSRLSHSHLPGPLFSTAPRTRKSFAI